MVERTAEPVLQVVSLAEVLRGARPLPSPQELAIEWLNEPECQSLQDTLAEV